MRKYRMAKKGKGDDADGPSDEKDMEIARLKADLAAAQAALSQAIELLYHNAVSWRTGNGGGVDGVTISDPIGWGKP